MIHNPLLHLRTELCCIIEFVSSCIMSCTKSSSGSRERFSLIFPLRVTPFLMHEVTRAMCHFTSIILLSLPLSVSLLLSWKCPADYFTFYVTQFIPLSLSSSISEKNRGSLCNILLLCHMFFYKNVAVKYFVLKWFLKFSICVCAWEWLHGYCELFMRSENKL